MRDKGRRGDEGEGKGTRGGGGRRCAPEGQRTAKGKLHVIKVVGTKVLILIGYAN